MNLKLAIDLIGQAPAIIALIRNIKDLAGPSGIAVSITSIEDETLSTAQAELLASEQWRKAHPTT